jgi:hypothetical protein
LESDSSDVSDGRGQREHQVIIGNGQEFGLALREPCSRRGPLTLRAMPVAAAVVGDVRVGAVLAARDMPAERCRAAGLDRRYRFQLRKAHMAGVGVAPSGTMGAEDIRDLQDWTRHRSPALCGRFILFGDQAEPLQRAHHFADRIDGNARIERGRIELGVSKQNLDDPNIDVLLQKMRRETVPQRAWRNALGNLCHPGRGVTGVIELTGRHRVDRVLAGKQPGPGRAIRHQSRRSSSSCGETGRDVPLYRLARGA